MEVTYKKSIVIRDGLFVSSFMLTPEIDVWETMTPYFETRNIHFYVNKLGFHIVEFFNKKHRDPNMQDEYTEGDGMFRFQKIVGWTKMM